MADVTLLRLALEVSLLGSAAVVSTQHRVTMKAYLSNCIVGDCGQAGALPGGKKKRELPMSRIARGLYPDSMLKARQWNPAPNPFDDTPSPPPPKPGVEVSDSRL